MSTETQSASTTPLCDAVRSEDWPKVDELLASNPIRHTKEVDRSGATPLHWAACVGNADLVKRLLKVYPAAARKQDKFNKRTPLHYATFHYARQALKAGATYARAESVEALVQSYPEGSQVLDMQGNLAIRYALDKQAPPESLQMLERATYPDQVPILDVYHGWAKLEEWAEEPETFANMLDRVDNYHLNPIQHAVAKNAPPQLVQSMIATCPHLARTSFDSRRRSLLHLAALTNADTEVLMSSFCVVCYS